MIIIDDISQRDPEWYALKAGVPGASEFSRIVQADGSPSKSRQEYIYELAGEKITGIQEETYQSFSMKQGIIREDEARRTYEFVTGESVHQVAFVFKDEKRNVGCSPDSLMPNTGLEIKCPMMKHHAKQLLNGGIPSDKHRQIQGSMWVCGFSIWQFMSYYPGMAPFILEVERDYKFTSALEHEMESFLQELEETYDKLRRKHGSM